MLNTPAAWEAMPDDEARSRVARMRVGAAAHSNVYAAFAPWQHLSTGSRELDALLMSAGLGSSSSSSSGGVSAATSAETAATRGSTHSTAVGPGGLAVGGIHELYGPPLSGKSHLASSIGAEYVRKMTACRQWCLDETQREATWVTESACSANTDDDDARDGARGIVPTAAVLEWEAYVCLVRGTASSSSSSTSTASSTMSPLTHASEVTSWQRRLTAAFPRASQCLAASRELPQAADGYRYAGPPQQQSQCDYAADHCHVCVVATPNDLLSFLASLAETDDMASLGTQAGSSAPGDSVPAQDNSATSCVSRTGITAAPPAGASKRQRSTSSDTDEHEMSSCYSFQKSSFSAATTSTSSRMWALQRQRLLIIDGLDRLWLHPSFGNHAGTHAGQLFAVELHRLLRAFVTPRVCPLPPWSSSTNGATRLPGSARTLTQFATAVVVNGCQGGSQLFPSPQQLQCRLRWQAGGTMSSYSSSSSSSPWLLLPRPAGNPVWWVAADTRCLVEPANCDLVSIPALPRQVSGRDRMEEEERWMAAPGAVEPQRTSLAAALLKAPRTVFVSSSTSAVPAPRGAVEAHVTVVQGAGCVCAGWLRRGADVRIDERENEDGEEDEEWD